MSVKTITTSNQSFCPPPLRNGSMQTSLPLTLPYGTQQGSYCGVVASSNRDDGFFSGESNYVDGLIYTGFRYQCVEFARRFLLHTTGCVFESCGRASAIFHMNHITDVETNKTYPLIKHENGKSLTPPSPGDVIIYGFHQQLVPFGHVGIISYVDDKQVGVIEQNMVFGSFTSPNPNDINAEKCIARMLTLELDPEQHTYTIREIPPTPECLGWLSYPTAPRRELLFKPFRPLPEHIAIRNTPLNHPKHPSISIYTLPEGIDIATGKVQHIYGCKHGVGEELCGGTAAVIRVIRTTLQMLFDRRAMCKDFLNLPANPLHAPLTPCSSELADLFEALIEANHDLENSTSTTTNNNVNVEMNEELLLQHVATYFGIPVEWCAAMQREFSRGELHFSAMLSFTYNVASRSDRLAVFGSVNCKDKHNEYIERLPSVCQHDESWNFTLADFNTPRILTEMDHMSKISSQLRTAVDLLDPRYVCWMAYKFRWDFTGYLKAVETSCGPRTAFTIVLRHNMDGLERDLVSLLQGYCERAKYPVCVIAEKDLHYDDESGTLYAVPNTTTNNTTTTTTTATSSSASSSSEEEFEWISSPNTFSPSGMYEVNFIYTLGEWHDILHSPIEHEALFKAAMDKRSDVIFAKPLWGYLCSGVMNVTDHDDINSVEGGGHRNKEKDGMQPIGAVTTSPTSIHTASSNVKTQELPLSIKFFNISRRLYELALPKQSPENWDRDISEYKDSCRRIHLTWPVQTKPEAKLMVTAAAINFGMSAITAHCDVQINSIHQINNRKNRVHHGNAHNNGGESTKEEPILLINTSHGKPACYAHMFDPDIEKKGGSDDDDDDNHDDNDSNISNGSIGSIKSSKNPNTNIIENSNNNNIDAHVDSNDDASEERKDAHERCEHADKEKERLQGKKL